MRKIRVNTEHIRGHKRGAIVSVETDEDGTPKDPMWRAKIRDAEIDECCEFVEPQLKNNIKREEKKNVG